MLSMRLSPAAWFGSLGAGAVGATVAVFLLGGSHTAQQQPTYVLHQDAQTGAAVVTSSAPASTAKPVAPKVSVVTSTVVVQQPAIQQEAPVATDPTSQQPQPSDTSQPAAPASSYPPPKGNPVGSTEFNPYVSPSETPKG